MLHYDVLGAGRPIVVLHGGAALHPSYLGNLADLDEDYQLIVVHLRGVGESPAPANPEDGSYWRQARDIEALREHLGLDLLTLVGHSAGTRLALAYAVQYPVGAMLLVTPPSAYVVDEPSDVDKLLEARREDPVFAAAREAAETDPDLTNDDTFNEWQDASAPFAYAAWTEVEQAHARIGRFSLNAARNYFSVDPPADFPDRLRKIQAPVHVVAGANDCVTGVSQVIALAGLFPAGAITMIDKCGHFPWVEQPAEFRKAADAFLRTVVPSETP